MQAAVLKCVPEHFIASFLLTVVLIIRQCAPCCNTIMRRPHWARTQYPAIVCPWLSCRISLLRNQLVGPRAPNTHTETLPGHAGTIAHYFYCPHAHAFVRLRTFRASDDLITPNCAHICNTIQLNGGKTTAGLPIHLSNPAVRPSAIDSFDHIAEAPAPPTDTLGQSGIVAGLLAPVLDCEREWLVACL
jgi:hypothetical protein